MKLTFFYDYHSPYSYLANSQMKSGRLATLGAEIEYRPINILNVMEKVHNQPTTMCMPKLSYAFADVARWARHYGVPLAPNGKMLSALEAGEYDNGLLSLAGLAAQELGIFEEMHAAIFEAIWDGDDDLTTAGGRDEFVNSRGIAVSDFWKLAMDSRTAGLLLKQNDEAVDRGVFGVPTFFVAKEMFFGNDRLDFVEAALRNAQEEEALLPAVHS